ncbi:hypothetical protein [Erysipelothrix aquatica]|uniref:hypothetical protein n=1 Tax=Erysipelothrix aquatica TaxID=2683714 RepID=UPI00135C36FA|nr:hypothetical protein [Erysipelothrix aquatica]
MFDFLVIILVLYVVGLVIFVKKGKFEKTSVITRLIIGALPLVIIYVFLSVSKINTASSMTTTKDSEVKKFSNSSSENNELTDKSDRKQNEQKRKSTTFNYWNSPNFDKLNVTLIKTETLEQIDGVYPENSVFIVFHLDYNTRLSVRDRNAHIDTVATLSVKNEEFKNVASRKLPDGSFSNFAYALNQQNGYVGKPEDHNYSLSFYNSATRAVVFDVPEYVLNDPYTLLRFGNGNTQYEKEYPGGFIKVFE